MCELPVDCEIIWDGTRSGPIGSPSSNRDLLFWEPEYAEEDDESAPRINVSHLSAARVADIAQHHADVLAAMGASWTRPCTVARRIGLSSGTVWCILRRLVASGAVESRKTTAISFSRGVLWYRRVRESSR